MGRYRYIYIIFTALDTHTNYSHNSTAQSVWNDDGTGPFGWPMNHSPTSDSLDSSGSRELQRLIDTIDKVSRLFCLVSIHPSDNFDG